MSGPHMLTHEHTQTILLRGNHFCLSMQTSFFTHDHNNTCVPSCAHTHTHTHKLTVSVSDGTPLLSFPHSISSYDGQTLLWVNNVLLQLNIAVGLVERRYLHTPPSTFVCFLFTTNRVFLVTLSREIAVFSPLWRCPFKPLMPGSTYLPLFFYHGISRWVKPCSIKFSLCDRASLYRVSPASHQTDVFIIPLQNNAVMEVRVQHR